MKKTSLAILGALALATTTLATSAQAQSQGFMPCDDHWSASFFALSVGENGEGIRSFYEGSVLLLHINTDEPAFFPEGVILLMPDGDGSDGPIGRHCFVNWGFSSMDVDASHATYDPARGLTLTIPASNTSPADYQVRDASVRVLVNVGAGTITPLN